MTIVNAVDRTWNSQRSDEVINSQEEDRSMNCTNRRYWKLINRLRRWKWVLYKNWSSATFLEKEKEAFKKLQVCSISAPVTVPFGKLFKYLQHSWRQTVDLKQVKSNAELLARSKRRFKGAVDVAYLSGKARSVTGGPSRRSWKNAINSPRRWIRNLAVVGLKEAGPPSLSGKMITSPTFTEWQE